MADMASELEAIAVRLRRAGEDDLVRELTSAMRRGVQPVPGQIRAGLRTYLPDLYADELNADLDVKISVSPGSSSSDARVTVYAQSGRARKLRRLDGGELHHPLWGNRNVHWPLQKVTPGWFTGPAEEAEPRVLAGLEQALHDVAAKAASKGA